MADHNVVGAVVLIGLTWELISGQQTSVNQQTCTYSFMVPQANMFESCHNYARQQIDILTNKIDELQGKVNLLELNGINRHDKSPPSLNPTFSCNCDNSTSFSVSFRDCQDVQSLGLGITGVIGLYKIEPVRDTRQVGLLQTITGNNGSSSQKYWLVNTWEEIEVPCDFSDEDIGWTVIMRRRDMDVSFDRGWYDYKWGFGNKTSNGDFWLGLENMHRITSQVFLKYSLWVIIKDYRAIPHVLPYGTFAIGDESTNYTITISDYHGKIPSIFKTGMMFETKDFGQVYHTGSYYSNTVENCANTTQATGGGGWWFTSRASGGSNRLSRMYCGDVNLNARGVPYAKTFGNITSVEMKIRPDNNASIV